SHIPLLARGKIRGDFRGGWGSKKHENKEASNNVLWDKTRGFGQKVQIAAGFFGKMLETEGAIV
ncbi:MAG TPA: hypothetical protein DCP22_07525, partial [Ruminococcaceae bacterium]|nr:hypothetical protein [Oscillospiraceae bacterium]